MQIAQNLYENGHITYMRTDSTSLSKEAVKRGTQPGRSSVRKRVLASSRANVFDQSKERPRGSRSHSSGGNQFELPESLRGILNDEQFKLFDLIWKRTIACQMADARKKRATVTVEADGAIFQASGTSIEFEGFLRAYVEGSDDPEAELAEQEVLLPEMKVDTAIGLQSARGQVPPPLNHRLDIPKRP